MEKNIIFFTLQLLTPKFLFILLLQLNLQTGSRQNLDPWLVKRIPWDGKDKGTTKKVLRIWANNFKTCRDPWEMFIICLFSYPFLITWPCLYCPWDQECCFKMPCYNCPIHLICFWQTLKLGKGHIVVLSRHHKKIFWVVND